MTATVHSLQDHRRKSQPVTCCPCADDFTCYPHRLAELLSRIEDSSAVVEDFQFCDLSTFRRLTSDVRDVLAGIVDQCLPDERTAR